MIKSIDNKLLFLILLSLLFLALNSIFCKIALVNNYIDAYSFTFFRVFFAALTLILIFLFKYRKFHFSKTTNWLSSFMLFLYAISFSYAYLSIDAGFGTLLLFGVVQVVMALSSLFYKEKISMQKLFGILLATFGLIYLLYPSSSLNISIFHSFLMVLSGFAWAIYTVLGKKSENALLNTMDSFFKALIFVVIFYFLFDNNSIFITYKGLLLSFISGSITSAIGYVLWYSILPKIEILTASVIQLFVPIISIFISVIILNELLTLDLILSTIIIFIGVLLTISVKNINQNI